MASFAAQAALRSKWTSLVEEHTIEVPQEVSNKVTSVVGWLKQASLEVRAAGRRAVNSLSGGGASMGGGGLGAPNGTMPRNLVIIHFNDVYNVEQHQGPEPVGGAARFCTAVNSFQHLEPLVLFSGDAFSPSMLSTFTKGEQMVPVLNDIGTHCAVFGNHDFDHGLEILSQWVSQCNFPWLMSNVLDNETGRPLGEGRITHVVHWAGRRIGLLGLVEQEWLDTLATINPEEVTFLDFVEAGRKLGAQLKQEGCDYVIALTHMRTPNDVKLAANCPEIDLILGGHDHVYEVKQINGTYVVKSGTDFKQFSKITVCFGGGGAALASVSNTSISSMGGGPGTGTGTGTGTPSSSVSTSSIAASSEKLSIAGEKPKVIIEEVNVTSDFEEDPQLKEKLEKYSSVVEGKMDQVLGCFAVPLDGRFTAVRTSESNLGNWVCDVVLAATGADLVILNSGTFRSDQVHPAGDFTMRDLVNVIPMRDPIVVLKISGAELVQLLENGVSMYPKLEGRFPQVAGISFGFDSRRSAGSRVDPDLVRIGDEYLNLHQHYRLATKSYLHTGCDGYVLLKDAQVVMDEDECPELGLAIQNHFQAINMRLGKTKKHSKHRQSLVTLSRRHSLVKMLDGSELDGPPPLRRASTIDSHSGGHGGGSGGGVCGGVGGAVAPNPGSKLMRRASLDDLEQESCQLTPRIEHRIVVIHTDEKRQELQIQRQRLEADSVIQEVDEHSPQEQTPVN